MQKEKLHVPNFHGQPPITRGTNNGRDELIVLHHDMQNPDGPLVEMRESLHRKFADVFNPFEETTIDRAEFGGDRMSYWMQRLREWND